MTRSAPERGAAKKQSPRRSGDFSLRVKSVLSVPGRGLSITGVAEHGSLPPPGTPVSIWVRGQRTARGVIASGPMTNVQPPEWGFLLRISGAADIPAGASLKADA